MSMSITERVTITLSADLVEGIDRLERNRSRFIAEAVEHELTRRRREALLSSIRNPHPETADPMDGCSLGRRARLGEGIRVTLDRGTVVLVELDPTIGREPRGVRPCAVSDP